MPYIYSQAVWNAKAEDETKVLDSEFERCKIVVIEITTTNFSGTIDLQGKVHELSAYSNVPWVRQDQAAAQTPSVAQISHTGNTSVVRYVILGYWRRLKLVMTRTVGTISCGVAGSSDAQVFPYIAMQEGFGGNIYSKTMTMGDNDATRFETTTKKLRDVIILVETNGMVFGETGVEVYTVGAGAAIGFVKVDISTLYFKNSTGGQNGKVTILGVEE